MAGRITNDLLPLSRLQPEMNNLFTDMVENALGTRAYAAAYPGVNLWEDGDTAYVEAELPGMTMNDMEVAVMGNQVTIKGGREIAEPDAGSFRRRERPQGAFARMLSLPWEIDAEHVEATLHDGVLTIRLPKSGSSKPRKIQVQAA
jgi:HSP20 family protein